MNCREFIIEFEERGTLSEPATLHLTICADCRKTSERQRQIWLMIEGLEPVSAPSDFDFHVKARIANVKPSDYQTPRFLPILRYVLPLSVVILLLSLFAFNSTYFSDEQFSAQTAQGETETPDVVGISSFGANSTDQFTYAVPNQNKAVTATDDETLISAAVIPDTPNTESEKQTGKVKLPSNRSVKSSRVKTENGAGINSRDIASKDSFIRTPRGIDLNPDTAGAPQAATPKPINDGETLSIIGIKFVSKNGRRTVATVQDNSIAGRSGVKVGDVIEKFNDNFLTVLRGTERLEIKLRNDVNR